MPIIRPISDLRNHADKISRLCHKESEPVFITKNGHGDMVIMSLARYKQREALIDLYQKLDEGERSFKERPRGYSHRQVMKDLRKIVR